MQSDKQQDETKITRVADVVAEVLQTETDRMPPSEQSQAQAEIWRKSAQQHRESERENVVRVTRVEPDK